MSAPIFITDREARALREDSLSSVGDVAVSRLRPQPSRVYGPHRGRLAAGKIGPRCRACTQRIADRSPVVFFKIRTKGAWNDAEAVIHQECPDVESTS